MSNLTPHLQGRNTKVKLMSRIIEQIYVDSETGKESFLGWFIGLTVAVQEIFFLPWML